MIRAVLFDIDGTLIRTGGAGSEAFGRVSEILYGISGGTRTLHFHGRTDTALVEEFLKLHRQRATADEVARFLDAYVFLLQHRLEVSRGEVLPGVRAWLVALASLPHPPVLGLLTGNIRLGAELKLRAHQLWSGWILGAFGDDHSDRNELARIAHRRLNQHLGRTILPEEILVVGDTPADIECARAINAPCLAVATGGSSRSDLEKHHPRWSVENLTAIDPIEILQ